MEGELAILVPIVLLIVIGAVLCCYFYWRHRTQREVQQTVRTAIKQGQELTPEILERLGQTTRPKKPRDSDLRRGIMLICVGLGLAAFGILIPEEEAMRAMMALGSVPLMIGIAYLGLWKFARSDKSD